MIDEIRMAIVLCRVCGSNVSWSRGRGEKGKIRKSEKFL